MILLFRTILHQASFNFLVVNTCLDVSMSTVTKFASSPVGLMYEQYVSILTYGGGEACSLECPLFMLQDPAFRIHITNVSDVTINNFEIYHQNWPLWARLIAC